MDYWRSLLEFGTFYLEYSDAIREGDGEHLLKCWRYLLHICKSADRRNNAVEVLNMLCQYEFELPPQQDQELIWSRFISTHASPRHNIPEDLHQEHLNRVIKDAIRDLGANKTEVAIVHAGEALGTLDPVLWKFDVENNVRNQQVPTSLQVQLKILRSSLSNCSKQKCTSQCMIACLFSHTQRLYTFIGQ